MPAHGSFRHQAVVATAQETKIRHVDRPIVGKRFDVVDLQVSPALATRSVRRDKRALTAVTDEYHVPDCVGYIARALVQLPVVGVKSR